VGVTPFISRLQTSFLNQLDDKEIPPHVDPSDGDAVRAWFQEAFGRWFLEHRNDVLAREWVRRGWAEVVLKPDASGELKQSYRVKPQYVETIDDWMQDKID
jgi:hypothetical protein